ncbi:MAG TPA: type II toxin-antitoxin system Phd/YefM family antitoxin [Acidobacteriota bacterium]|jgi:prevent-host-death family protein|nr:type II toxin-antitoxin system Phd/YefM family antitoxin [Acidobacteriota bacterium]
MPEIGVRELKVRASEIIRDVRKRHVRYIITYRGRPVGLLMPLEEPSIRESAPAPKSARAIWDELTRLGKKIGRRWPKTVTSVDVLSQMRR